MLFHRQNHIIFGATVLIASPCLAQTMTVQSITASSPNLGKVVSAATGDTTFTVAASGGAITVASGGGKRVSAGTSITTVTVHCTGGGCANGNANIAITNVGTPTLRARGLTNFTVAMGTATLTSGPTGTNPVSFTIGPIGNNLTKTFFVGGNFPIAGNDSGLGTGSATSSFRVSIVPASGGTTNTGTGTAIASVSRPISLSFLPASGLAFGRVIRPSVGSGTVSIHETTGVRAVTGTNAIGLPSPAPGRVVYTATGEGGQVISIAVPATFSMTRGADTLTVTTTATATGSQTLSSTLGSAGTFAFGVGGSFPFSTTTVTGKYSGTFIVTVAYN